MTKRSWKLFFKRLKQRFRGQTTPSSMGWKRFLTSKSTKMQVSKRKRRSKASKRKPEFVAALNRWGRSLIVLNGKICLALSSTVREFVSALKHWGAYLNVLRQSRCNKVMMRSKPYRKALELAIGFVSALRHWGTLLKMLSQKWLKRVTFAITQRIHDPPNKPTSCTCLKGSPSPKNSVKSRVSSLAMWIAYCCYISVIAMVIAIRSNENKTSFNHMALIAQNETPKLMEALEEAAYAKAMAMQFALLLEPELTEEELLDTPEVVEELVETSENVVSVDQGLADTSEGVLSLDEEVVDTPEMIASTIADNTKGLDQAKDKPWMTLLSASYTAGGGIGYPMGYASLSAQSFYNSKWSGRFLPMTDLRGHYFNDGQWAANAGIGARYLTKSSNFVIGTNAFYDYREYTQTFNQVGLGLEFFTPIIDFRVNGYLPIGNVTQFSNKQVYRYKRYIVISREHEKALGGVSAEIGSSVNRWFPCSNWNVYGGIGNYFYPAEKHGTNVLGTSFYTGVQLFKYFNFECKGSYDPVFGGKIQGVFGISIPLGKKGGSSSNCNHNGMQEIFRQPIRRNEIIIMSKKECDYETNF